MKFLYLSFSIVQEVLTKFLCSSDINKNIYEYNIMPLKFNNAGYKKKSKDLLRKLSSPTGELVTLQSSRSLGIRSLLTTLVR